MKPIVTFIVALLCLNSFAQQQTTNHKAMMKEVDGYIIRIVKADAGTYGYEIMRGSERLIMQRRNPYTGSPIALKKRDDAMQTASWLVTTLLKKQKQLPEGKRLPDQMLLSMPIPAEVAKRLNVDIQ